MLDVMTSLASGGGGPIVSIPELDPLKGWINWIMAPELSLPLFTIAFIAMMVGYKWWTKPLVAIPLAMAFTTGYLGLALVDHNYFLILEKPDNVPITIMIFATGLCLWTAFRQAAINDTRLKAGQPLIEGDKDDKVLVWPDLVYSEMICLVLASALLVFWALAFRAPLEAPANPAGPPNPSKAPWYFLGLQEMLVYFDPWMAGVLLPGMIVTGLIAMPYMDTNPKGNGYYTVAHRPFAMYTWLFGFLILWVVLIVFGTFLRGPNWNFFGPTEYWDSHKQVPLTNVNLSDYFWIFGLNKPLPTRDQFGPVYLFVREAPGLLFVGFWVLALPVILAKTVMRRLYEQMGPIRFYIMAIHFVIMALMPVKMVLRWLFVLKYFVYLPEWNLNL